MFSLTAFAQVETSIELKILEDTLGFCLLQLPVNRAFIILLVEHPRSNHHIGTELGVILIVPRNTYLVVGKA